MLSQAVLLASIRCQNVLTKLFFSRAPWHFEVAAHISVSLYLSLSCLIRTLWVGVMPRPQPCRVQWRLEEFIIQSYTWWWAALTALQWRLIMKEAANKTNIAHPLLPPLPFFTCSNLTYPHPVFPAPQHVRLHTCVACNACHHGKCWEAVNLG